MHIVDGILSHPVVIGGAVLSIAGVAYGLRQIDEDRIPQVGVLSATFFLASHIHFPVGVTSVHLILNGLLGITLGWAAFPAMFIALLLQAAFFGYGGLLVLGVNVLNIALPAVIVWYMFHSLVQRSAPRQAAFWAGIAGASSIALTALMVTFSLALSGQEFRVAANLVFYIPIPVLLLEGLLTAAAVGLIVRVRPDFFAARD